MEQEEKITHPQYHQWVSINEDFSQDLLQETDPDQKETISLTQKGDKVLTSEEAMELCGGFGKFQFLNLIVMLLGLKSVAFFYQAFAFLEIRPMYECYLNDSWSICSSEVFCNDSNVQWRIFWQESETLDNLIIQYGLICEPDYLIGLLGSVFLLGVSIGCCTFTRMGDVFGRKPIYISGLIVQIIANVMVISATNLYVGYLSLFLLGLSVPGRAYVGYNYMVENQPKHKQVLAGSLEPTFQALVYLMVCGYFYFISKNWKYLQIPSIVFALIGGVLVLLFMPESPRFLVSKGRYDEARIVFSKIAKINGKGDNFAEFFIFKEEVKNEEIQDPYGEGLVKKPKANIEQDQSLKTLWADRRLRINLIFSNLTWSVNIFNYYLIVFYFKYFPGNLFTNTIAFGVADITAYLISGCIVKQTSTRIGLISAYLTVIVGSGLYILLYQYVSVIPFIIIICRVGISMSINTVYVTHNRIFPTQFASTAFGFLNLTSHLIGIAAPQIAELDDPYPFLVCLANATIAIISCLFLKEIDCHSKPKVNLQQ